MYTKMGPKRDTTRARDYSKTEWVACDGRNELPTIWGITIAQAKVICDDIPSCVSFEESPPVIHTSFQDGDPEYQFSESCLAGKNTNSVGKCANEPACKWTLYST